jgi:hypothetical protein
MKFSARMVGLADYFFVWVAKQSSAWSLARPVCDRVQSPKGSIQGAEGPGGEDRLKRQAATRFEPMTHCEVPG